MTTRSASALLALLGLLLLVPAASATVPAKLRVLTPDRVMDPGTTYIVDEGVTVPTRPDADCFGAPGGSGAEFTYEKPNVLSLLATAGRTTKAVAPLSLTDQFGFGLGICGVGGVQASMGESFWYFKVNHSEATVGADQLEIKPGDEVLFYLAPDAFPNPNPAELELVAPARAAAGTPFSVSVLEHACVTQSSPPFATECTSGPASGVTISGGDSAATTGAGRERAAGGGGARRGAADRLAGHRHPLRDARDLRRDGARGLSGDPRLADRRQPAGGFDQGHRRDRLDPLARRRRQGQRPPGRRRHRQLRQGHATPCG